MIATQLGPPPAAASRGGSAASGAPADGCTGTLVATEGGGFVAVLNGCIAPATSAAAPAGHTPVNAAGPLLGELQEPVADADGSAIVIDPAALLVMGAPPVAVVPEGAAAAAPVPVAPAAVPSPVVATPGGEAALIPGLVPVEAGVTAAPAAASSAPGPAATSVAVPAPVPASAPAPGAAAPVAPGAAAPAPPPIDAAPAPVASGAEAVAAAASAAAAAPAAGAGDDARSAGPPAATVTLTLAPVAGGASGGTAADTGGPANSPPPPVVVADAEAPPAAPAAPATPAAPAAPAGHGAAAAVVAATPAGDLSAALGAREGGPLSSPHELAREVGDRIRMGVREGGRELVVHLRPAELGQLTIRLTSNDGVLTAHIMADRPEAARMLSQSLSHLGSALGELGYSLDNLDVAYGGGDPREAQQSSPQGRALGRRGAGGPDGDDVPPPPGLARSDRPAGTPSRLDLLA